MIYIGAGIIAMFIFAYMRNKQAARNDKRRERLWEMQERLMETLKNKAGKPEEENKADVDSSNHS